MGAHDRYFYGSCGKARVVLHVHSGTIARSNDCDSDWDHLAGDLIWGRETAVACRGGVGLRAPSENHPLEAGESAFCFHGLHLRHHFLSAAIPNHSHHSLHQTRMLIGSSLCGYNNDNMRRSSGSFMAK